MWYFTATEIQAVWRGYVARRDYKEMREYIAAVDIQRAWRGFQCFSDYVFTIADVVIAQRTARQWIAIRKVRAVREVKAATTIQAAFRGYSGHMAYLYSLVNIIVVQSVARKWMHAKEYPRKLEDHKAAIHKKNDEAATLIQKNWRAFWTHSDYVNKIHKATRIQSVARRYIAMNEAEERRQAALAVSKAVESMRARNASRKIQRAWRMCVIRRAEDVAARIIQAR